MLYSALGYNGAMSAPHRAATLAGQEILAAGGSAIEAMVAAASTIAVTYPHMNGIGGDGFWLIHRPGEAPVGIFAGGHAAALATPEWYAERGHINAIPARGGQAALTVPGTIGGWEAALALVAPRAAPAAVATAGPRHRLCPRRHRGNRQQSRTTAEKLDGLKDVPGFAETFLIDGEVPAPGDWCNRRWRAR
ncbi:MAG: gamma-glutamyltransferase [Paracoccaceae bacterium]